MSRMRPLLRSHQGRLLDVIRSLARGESSDIRDILAAVTPGGGKSLLPVIAAAHLIKAGVVDRVCWIVPRDSLRLQAEEAFEDPLWRQEFQHGLSVRAAENGPDPCRGQAGYVTTFQAVAAAPMLHMAEFRRHRYLLVLDELHHLPALADAEPSGPTGGSGEAEAAWSRAIMPLLELSRIRLLLSGTLMRADGKGILWLPYRPRGMGQDREVELSAPGWATIGYTRRDALAERAVLPVRFGALAGEASWMEEGVALGPHALDAAAETTRPALFTALRTGFADHLLDRAFDATRTLRMARRQEKGIGPGEQARGLGKLLVVAPDQREARRYLERIRSRLPEARRLRDARIATSDERDTAEVLSAFRLLPEPAILVTVAMAYEGLDAPEVAVVAALTHIRSRPWLEQMVARATRVDHHAGPWERQQALVFHPDDLLFRAFRRRIETEQGMTARPSRATRDQGQKPPEWLMHHGKDSSRLAVTPLSSAVTGLRWEQLRAGPGFQVRPMDSIQMARPDGLVEEAGKGSRPPSLMERALRRRIGELVSAQVVEDEHELRMAKGQGGYHRYNAILKRVMGGRGRAVMTLAELEATVAWLERNRLSDHLRLLDDDPRHEYCARRVGHAERRRLSTEGQEAIDDLKAQADFWRPPIGRPVMRRFGRKTGAPT